MKTLEEWLKEIDNSMRPHDAIIKEIQHDAWNGAIEKAVDAYDTAMREAFAQSESNDYVALNSAIDRYSLAILVLKK